jgi:cyclohexa-1,5-dienecarbonyl-CoA hydratase
MSVSVTLKRAQTRASIRFHHSKGNIITMEMLAALRSGLDSLAGNQHLKLVTLEGAGDHFSFGASIPEHTREHISRVLPETRALLEDLLEFPAITAAVVRGRCLGGGFELALACDFIFAADGAEFGLPEINLGVFPPAASVLLPARVNGARATSAILTGESQSTARWLAAGLVEHAAPVAELDAAVDAWFDRHLAHKSAAALRHAAAAARASVLAEIRTTLPELERLYLDELMQSHDAVEGMEAFLEKRRPQWQDR